MTFPTETGWEGEPIEVKWKDIEGDPEPRLSHPEALRKGKTFKRIDSRGIKRIDWEKQDVLVTSENAAKTTSTIEFDWSDDEVDITVTDC